MGLEQMYALGPGRKFKRPYVSEINARKSYLPQVYAQKEQDIYRDKMSGLEEKKLEQDKMFGLQNLALQQDAQSEAKKRNRTARNLGYANIGLGAGIGIADNWDTIKSGVKSLFPTPTAPTSLGGVLTPSPGQSFGGIEAGASMGGPIDWLSDAYTDYITPAIKTLGGGIWDAGKGIFDSVLGDTIDFDGFDFLP